MSYNMDEWGPEEHDRFDEMVELIREQRLDDNQCMLCGKPLKDKEAEQCAEGCEESYPDVEAPGSEFADPGGKSALRAAGPGNPRNLPCPTCGVANRLTPKDRALGYQCDSCADAAEGGF